MKILIGASFKGSIKKYLKFSDSIKKSNIDFGILVGNLYDFSFTDLDEIILDNESIELKETYKNGENKVINYTKEQLINIGFQTAISLSIDEISTDYCFKIGITFVKKYNEIISCLADLNIPILTVINPIIFDIQNTPSNIINIFNSIYIYNNFAVYGIKIENEIDIKFIKNKLDSIKNRVNSIFIAIYEVRNYIYEEDGEVKSFYYPYEDISSNLQSYCLLINLKCKILRIAEGNKYEIFNFKKKYEGYLKNGILFNLNYNL